MEFEDLTFSASVPMKGSGVPTLGSVALSLLKPTATRKKPKTILSRCSGVLEPGMLTLVGAPLHPHPWVLIGVRGFAWKLSPLPRPRRSSWAPAAMASPL